jgi:hypothetical protein
MQLFDNCPHKFKKVRGTCVVKFKKKEEKAMLKITPMQAERVNRLVSELCANCDQDGNCVLLDDGEAHRCVQLISVYGIYCNYFKNAVLPADKELHEEIQKQNHKP